MVTDEMQQYGTPGGSLQGNKSTFGKSKSDVGALGEQQTANMLERTFKKDSDIHVFHDLTIPGSKANIDHVIVRGKNVLVVDSKRWKPGFYWSVGGKAFRGMKRFEPAESRTVGMANDRLRQLLQGTGARLNGVIVVHQSKPGFCSFAFLRAADNVSVRNASMCSRHLRSFLGTPQKPDAEILRRLHTLIRG